MGPECPSSGRSRSVLIRNRQVAPLSGLVLLPRSERHSGRLSLLLLCKLESVFAFRQVCSVDESDPYLVHARLGLVRPLPSSSEALFGCLGIGLANSSPSGCGAGLRFHS